MVVLGIDPGGASTGYGLLRVERGRLTRLDSGTIRPPRRLAFSDRLLYIYQGVKKILESGRIDEVAVEDVYQGVNHRTASRIGHVRGVVLLAGAEAGLPVAEYPPNEVKSAVAGNGLATKEQVQFMVQQILRLESPPASLDESDAIAVAICHCHRCREEVKR